MSHQIAATFIKFIIIMDYFNIFSWSVYHKINFDCLNNQILLNICTICAINREIGDRVIIEIVFSSVHSQDYSSIYFLHHNYGSAIPSLNKYLNSQEFSHFQLYISANMMICSIFGQFWTLEIDNLIPLLMQWKTRNFN